MSDYSNPPCARCGKPFDSGIFSASGNYLCYGCFVTESAPPVTLVELWGTGDLVNPINRMKISIGKEGLLACGFRLKRSKEYIGPLKDFPYKKALTLKYTGPKKCHLIRGFNWPIKIGCCLNRCEV